MLVHGLATVEVDGLVVATVRPGGFIGEMSLLRGEGATALVTVTQDARLFEVEAAALKALLAQEVEFRAEFHHALGSELSAKVLALRGGTRDRQPA